MINDTKNEGPYVLMEHQTVLRSLEIKIKWTDIKKKTLEGGHMVKDFLC